MNRELTLRVAILRKERKITQKDLAKWLSVTPAAVSKWENGQSFPDTYLLPRLAAFFNVNIDDLFEYEKIMDISQKRVFLNKIKNSYEIEELQLIWEEIKKVVSCYYADSDLIIQILTAMCFKKLPKDIEKECLQYGIKWLHHIKSTSEDIEKIRMCTLVEGNLYLKNKEFDEAIKQYEVLNQVELNANVLLANAYNENGEKEKSLTVLKESYELSIQSIIQIKMIEIKIE